MKKRDWKSQAWEAEERARDAEARASALAGKVRELEREVADKRENWAPIKTTHPWTPRDPGSQPLMWVPTELEVRSEREPRGQAIDWRPDTSIATWLGFGR